MTIIKVKFFGFFLFCSLVQLFVAYPVSAQSDENIIGDWYPAFFAESGNWWDVARPGEGLVLERHKNDVALTLFTYGANGEPEFYMASGPIRVGQIVTSPPLVYGAASTKFFIWESLYKFKNGPVFNSSQRFLNDDPPANEYERVGEVKAEIFPMGNRLTVWVRLDADRVPEGAERFSERYYMKSIFGYAGFGKDIGRDEDDDVSLLQASRPCWVDLRGHWVFVDQSGDEARNAWRFNFTELETTPPIEDMTCRYGAGLAVIGAEHTLIYRDTVSGATLRCVVKNIYPRDDENYQPEDQRCVLRNSDDEAVLWFSVKDVGAKQILASPGEPHENHMYWRGGSVFDNRITGLRLD